jgi:hypothetical protein
MSNNKGWKRRVGVRVLFFPATTLLLRHMTTPYLHKSKGRAVVKGGGGEDGEGIKERELSLTCGAHSLYTFVFEQEKCFAFQSRAAIFILVDVLTPNG